MDKFKFSNQINLQYINERKIISQIVDSMTMTLKNKLNKFFFCATLLNVIYVFPNQPNSNNALRQYQR